MRVRTQAASAGAMLLAAWASASAFAQPSDFYAGKTIDFTVGSDSGGGYDIYARAIARHLGRYIPGNPNVVVRNMPGAGSGRAAAYIYSVAPKDGTAIGAVFPGAIMGLLLEDRAPGAFEPIKFQYLGSGDSGTRVCATFQNSKIKTVEDAIANTAKMGASAAGGSTRDYANMLRKTTGAKFELVTGYKGTAELTLAMERGEIDGLCGWDFASLKSQKPDWLRDKKVNILMQIGLDPDDELTKLGAPQVWNFIKNEDDRKAVELVVSQQIFGRPYLAPPGTPPEQLALLRNAFSATMKDRQFLEDAARQRIDITPSDGMRVQSLVEKLYASPSAVVDRAKALIKP